MHFNGLGGRIDGLLDLNSLYKECKSMWAFGSEICCLKREPLGDSIGDRIGHAQNPFKFMLVCLKHVTLTP